MIGTRSTRWAPLAVAAAMILAASIVTPLAGRGSQAGSGAAAAGGHDPARQDWMPLFNGRDLDGWTAKFAKR